jgi:hypothetical protein
MLSVESDECPKAFSRDQSLSELYCRPLESSSQELPRSSDRPIQQEPKLLRQMRVHRLDTD